MCCARFARNRRDDPKHQRQAIKEFHKAMARPLDSRQHHLHPDLWQYLCIVGTPQPEVMKCRVTRALANGSALWCIIPPEKNFKWVCIDTMGVCLLGCFAGTFGSMFYFHSSYSYVW